MAPFFLQHAPEIRILCEGFRAYILPEPRVSEAFARCEKELGLPLAARLPGPEHRLGSPHLAGMALDMGQGLECGTLHELWRIAHEHFDIVQPLYLTPGWVHGECLCGGMCGYRAYPFLFEGCTGGHVFALQYALDRLGAGVPLTGRFGADTKKALSRLLPSYREIVDIRIWRSLEQCTISCPAPEAR